MPSHTREDQDKLNSGICPVCSGKVVENGPDRCESGNYIYPCIHCHQALHVSDNYYATPVFCPIHGQI